MLGGKPYNVTYDERSFIIDGQRTILLGGSFHYPRASPGDWPGILQKARDDGLNHVQIYVFWNYHEFKQGQYDFSGRGNLTYFFELAAQYGLFVNVRIGPYVCAGMCSALHCECVGDHMMWVCAVQNGTMEGCLCG
jgi:beta-galactosidase GanA